MPATEAIRDPKPRLSTAEGWPAAALARRQSSLIAKRAYRVRILMPIGSEKSDDAESDNRHERAKSDHNQVERGHDAPKGRFTRP